MASIALILVAVNSRRCGRKTLKAPLKDVVLQKRDALLIKVIADTYVLYII